MIIIEFMILIGLITAPAYFVMSFMANIENKIRLVFVYCLVCGWLLLSGMAGIMTMWEEEHDGIFEFFIYFFSNLAYVWNS
jgi:hypothetical protein